jgi:hypothetical protein
LESGISKQSVNESVWTQYILNQPKMKVDQMPRIIFKLPLLGKLVKSGDSMWLAVVWLESTDIDTQFK